jgi:hypothetical protein
MRLTRPGHFVTIHAKFSDLPHIGRQRRDALALEEGGLPHFSSARAGGRVAARCIERIPSSYHLGEK